MKKLLVILLVLCLANCANTFLRNSLLQTNQTQLIVAQCPPDMQSDIEQQDRIVGFIPYFYYQNGTGVSDISTTVQICHRNFEILDITWNVADTQMISNYTQCNDPLYNQDVVEVFLGTPENYLTKYLEVEVNPQGALFAANITNTNNSCSGISDSLIPCNQTGIFYSAQIADFGYKANAQIPVKLVTETQQAYHLKGNFFRIDHAFNGDTDYSCWRSTFVSPACFHVPSQFGDIFLV
ncbi:hypothetical protein ABPG72_009147 [Tetrahymena utriculariae]